MTKANSKYIQKNQGKNKIKREISFLKKTLEGNIQCAWYFKETETHHQQYNYHVFTITITLHWKSDRGMGRGVVSVDPLPWHTWHYLQKGTDTGCNRAMGLKTLGLTPPTISLTSTLHTQNTEWLDCITKSTSLWKGHGGLVFQHWEDIPISLSC